MGLAGRVRVFCPRRELAAKFARRVRRRSRSLGGDQALDIRQDRVAPVLGGQMPENQHARPPQVRSFPLLGLCLVIASVVFAAMFGRVSYGQSRPDQYQIEATYLYDFTKFVTWPAQGNVEPKP